MDWAHSVTELRSLILGVFAVILTPDLWIKNSAILRLGGF
jgi:hypothetical protein